MILNEKGILREFDLVVYPFKVVVVMGDLEEAVNKHYEPKDEQYNYLAPPPEDIAEAVYHVVNKKTGNYCIMIWVPKMDDCRGSYFCHESGHITLDIFKAVGAHIEYDNQEPFCYLLGTVFRLINGAFYEWKDFMDKKKVKDASAFRVDLISFLQDCKNEFNTEKDIDHFLDKWTPRLLESASKTTKKK